MGEPRPYVARVALFARLAWQVRRGNSDRNTNCLDVVFATSSNLCVSPAERIRELEEALRERDATIRDLKNRIAELEKIIEGWKRGHRVRPGGKLAQHKDARRAKGHGPGRPAGHEGSSRTAPEHVDREQVVQPPCRCPDCGGPIVPLELEAGLQRVEDIVPGRVEVTGYRRIPGHCERCGKRCYGPLPNGLGENPKIGTRAQAAIVLGKNEMNLSLGRTAQMMSVHYGMTISRAGIQQILHRAADVSASGIEQIRAQIVASNVAWGDETSLKVAGNSGYLWMVMTQVSVLFHASESRGTEVAEELLAGFHGTLHSDFYAVYWAIERIEHAPCWGHLIREARQIAERDPHRRTERFALRIKRLYVRGLLAQNTGGEHALAAQRRIRRDLDLLAYDVDLDRHKDVSRLQARILRHGDELVAFITNPALEATNNRAEREMRPIAMARHTSGGARSAHGAETFAVNRSIVRTAQLQGIDYHNYLMRARTAAAGNGPVPRLIKRARPARPSGGSRCQRADARHARPPVPD